MMRRLRLIVPALVYVLHSCFAAGPNGTHVFSQEMTDWIVRVEPGHPWRPPFGLDRVGQPISVLVEAAQRPQAASYFLSAFHKGKEVDRLPVALPDRPPFAARLAFKKYADEMLLRREDASAGRFTELVRQPIHLAEIEVGLEVRSQPAANPVDLGTILVPAGWALRGPGVSPCIDIAVFSRSRDEPDARLTAWLDSSASRRSLPIRLARGKEERTSFSLPPSSPERDRDVLHLSLSTASGAEVWHQKTQVMLVRDPPRWPRFGATYTKLRYDAPISIRDPASGAYSSLSYEKGWDPALRDVVVSFPSGARYVFWRGSSYIPFWAGKHNTGACYEWAEIISRLPGAVDCVEPLMDKELRYSRVVIVESTPARVHVRWTYQSTDLNYQVWGDEATEDYYFYPDGFGSRVLTLKANPEHQYELSEFIILTPQGAYPLEVLPERIVDVLSLDGRKQTFRIPFQPERDGDPRKTIATPAVYRLRLDRESGPAAVYFNPSDKQHPPLVFGPFFDRDQMVTPCYWGSHWPLARGNATGSKIDDRIALTPCHNSVMSWVSASPEPTLSRELEPSVVRGKPSPRRLRRWAWLIGMTDAQDDRLLEWSRSYAAPPRLALRGATLVKDDMAEDPRAIRIQIQDHNIKISLNPLPVCVNPVFELIDAPQGPPSISQDGKKLGPEGYCWDGRTLWLDGTVRGPTELRLEFKGTS
jgi:hypothetical protein